jgi:Flp pilus assembly protein TadD
VLKLQTEIANAVASALKVTLLGDFAAKIELGGTRNPDYFATGTASHESYEQALADTQKAIALAPKLGEGHAALAYVFQGFLEFTRASEEYERAIALAPGNAAILV